MICFEKVQIINRQKILKRVGQFRGHGKSKLNLLNDSFSENESAIKQVSTFDEK